MSNVNGVPKRIEEVQALEETNQRLAAELARYREARARVLRGLVLKWWRTAKRVGLVAICCCFGVAVFATITFVVAKEDQDIAEQHKPVDCWTVARDPDHLGRLKFRVGRLGRERLWMADADPSQLTAELRGLSSPDIAATLLIAEYHAELCPGFKFERGLLYGEWPSGKTVSVVPQMLGSDIPCVGPYCGGDPWSDVKMKIIFPPLPVAPGGLNGGKLILSPGERAPGTISSFQTSDGHVQ